MQRQKLKGRGMKFMVDWVREQMTEKEKTRHISWQSVELKVMASKWRRCGEGSEMWMMSLETDDRKS